MVIYNYNGSSSVTKKEILSLIKMQHFHIKLNVYTRHVS